MINQPKEGRCISSIVTLLTLGIIIAITLSKSHQVLGFHLSFGQRLLKSANQPQLNPASTLIRPIECRNANNHSEAGICMFSIDCMQNKGVPLSVCKHNYFVGTCCRLPDYNNFVGIVYDLRDTEYANQVLEARRTGIIPLSSETHHHHHNRPELLANGGGGSTTPSKIDGSSPVAPAGVAGTTSTTVLPSATQTGSSSTGIRMQISQQTRSADELATQTTIAASTSADTMGPTAAKLTAGNKLEDDKLEDRYIISSTSLFPSTQQPLVASSSISSQVQQVNREQEVSATKLKEGQTGMPSGNRLATSGGANGESARNADGIARPLVPFNVPLVASPNKQQQQIVVPSEFDSFQIQTTLTNHSQRAQEQPGIAAKVVTAPANGGLQQQPNHQNSAYELIKDDSLEVLSMMNSAHSPPTTQQQFNIIDSHLVQQENQDQRKPADNQQQSDKSTVVSVAQQQQQNSIYLVDDMQQKNQAQQNIVFANNHQQSSSAPQVIGSTYRPAAGAESSSPVVQSSLSNSTTLRANSQAPAQTASDQEFTLSSVGPVTSSVEDAVNFKVTSNDNLSTVTTTNHSTPPTLINVSGASHTNKSTSSIPEIISPTTLLAFPTSSPFVDLVSSNSAQTTTPFTTSLSTALLPNVSSHPYSPTTPPPLSSLVPVQTFSSSSTAYRFSPTTSSPNQQHKQATSVSPSLGFSQLYSNQHASSSSSSSHQEDQSSTSSTSHPHFAHIRPSLISQLANGPALQAATKIVTGGSSANNLIPGLSGLQSAILSHIPFKIASGLSSGLSSYLQAAMKPTGTRPLLSSNTAPSLQYQQQMMQIASNATKQSTLAAAAASSLSQTSTIRFPGATSSSPSLSPSSSSPTPPSTSNGSSSVEIMGTTGQPAVISNWQLGSSTQSAAAAAILRDFVKEAQQVCGRPQVNPSVSGGSEGKKRVARIVGGNQSLFGQWPWMVSLRQWRKGAFLHKCGAALLNENWAITAAHCVENVKASDLLLRLGEFDVSNQDEPYPYIERRVKTVVSHPSFDPKTFEYDLALLRFAEPIKYERNIVPVCVPSGNDTYVDRMATVIGWGRLYEDGPLPDVIQHVDVPIITNNECEKMYKNAGYIEEIPDMFICAGISKGGRDSCEGDSGGPLTMVDHDGRSYLVGIISWGIGCALPSQPGVYTRITAFSGWINQITAF